MMRFGFLVIGCPGSGKSWVCDQMRSQLHYVPHDAALGTSYLRAIDRAAISATKPLLLETPFSISQIMDPLAKSGFRITPVFIQEKPEVIAARYLAREGKPILPGHLTRQKTYFERAQMWSAFYGTSTEVLEFLRRHA